MNAHQPCILNVLRWAEQRRSDATGAADTLLDLFAKLDEYLRLQQVETDSFILQCRRDDLRDAINRLQRECDQLDTAIGIITRDNA